jgi:hypothetical protein
VFQFKPKLSGRHHRLHLRLHTQLFTAFLILVLVRRSVISFDFCHERLVFGRSFEFMKFLVHVFVGLLELEDFSFEVLDIELVLLVFLVDFFLFFLEFFVLFSKVAPVDFQLKSLGLLLVAFVSDKFLEIFL